MSGDARSCWPNLRTRRWRACRRLCRRIEAGQGHRHLLEAAAKVMKADARVHLVLVGDGELRDEIAAHARRLGVGARTSLLGHREDSAQLAAAFDVAVLASLSEGLPNAVMEAMAAGAPVVATAVGGVPELIEDGETGFLVPPADSEALAERIEFALSQADLTGPDSNARATVHHRTVRHGADGRGGREALRRDYSGVIGDEK